MSKKLKIGLGVTGALLVIGLVAPKQPTQAKQETTVQAAAPKPDNGSEYMAKHHAQTFVKRSLKSPATAQFSGERAFLQNDGRWVITGSVDSQNGFGAMLRSSYSCQVRKKDRDTWSLIEPCIIL